MEKDKHGKPLHAKSCIVDLGDFEDRLYQKYKRYAPVIKYSFLHQLEAKEVGDKLILEQGDYKNEFCKTTLPGDEVMVLRPPIGNPDYQEDEYWILKKTLYGLHRPPHHCYNTIKGILLKMGL